MLRNVDYESRRKENLAETIDKYIKDAVPIASDDIARDFDLSSATIRNIFAELEKSGYLTHPYTSGGRIPTDRGYRYYVDFLILQMELLDNEKTQIIHEYRKEIKRLDDILEKTSEVISMITRYTGIVSFLEWQDRFFYNGVSLIIDQPEFQDFEKLRIVIKAIEEKQHLLSIINREFSGNIKVYIGDEIGCPEMENCSLVVSNYRIKGRPLGKLAVLGPKRMEYTHAIPTLEYIAQVLTDVLSNT